MRRGVAAMLLVLIVASTAAAQPRVGIPGRLELGGGVLWTGAQSLGSRDANLTTGTGSVLRLFGSTSDLLGSAGFEGMVGVRLGRAIEVDALYSYSTPQLRTGVSGDSEGAAAVVAAERVQQHTISAGIVWYVSSRRTAARVHPFVAASAGYLRQLHEAATLVATGQTYSLGGGAKLVLASRPRHALKTVGVRLDARAVVRSKGIAFDGGRSLSPALGASLFVRF